MTYEVAGIQIFVSFRHKNHFRIRKFLIKGENATHTVFQTRIFNKRALNDYRECNNMT